jgi:Fe-S cluster biogenesis protein NfuA
MMLDRDALDHSLDSVRAMLRWHGGDIELCDVTTEGEVRIRFKAMCAGCQLRPFTLAAIVRPIILSVPGVTRVEAEGVRLSSIGDERLRDLRLSLPVVD